MTQPTRAEQHPIERFRQSMEAAEAAGIVDPNAMVLSTVDGDGRPSSRVVLLKAFDERGLVFYTNYESQKGRELLVHPEACVNFFWRELDQQIRVAGPVEQVSDAEADAYFQSRARGSRIGAWASQQSRPLASREDLERLVRDVEARFPDAVPRPPHWSGFRIKPRKYEFWKAGQYRLHDRFVYTEDDGGWWVQRLFP